MFMHVPLLVSIDFLAANNPLKKAVCAQMNSTHITQHIYKTESSWKQARSSRHLDTSYTVHMRDNVSDRDDRINMMKLKYLVPRRLFGHFLKILRFVKKIWI